MIEMQIKAPLRLHLTSIKLAKMTKEKNGKFWEELEKKKVTLIHALLVKLWLGSVILESNMELFPKNH